MKILPAAAIRAWDAFTIQQEEITPLDLMERAAAACYHWITTKYGTEKRYAVFCGTGNNGGDGLAIARMLNSPSVSVYIIGERTKTAADFKANLYRLADSTEINWLDETADFPALSSDTIVIDAIFGTGLNRAAAGLQQQLIEHINAASAAIVSIDIPSGLFADKSSKNNSVIQAKYTLGFQCYKLAFVMAENSRYFGEIAILDIGLSKNFWIDPDPKRQELYRFTDLESAKAILRPRNAHAHKGTFGHAMLIGGSHGKMGAITLSAKACLRSGVGLLTLSIPATENNIVQVAVPEAMSDTSALTADNLRKFITLGIGPGWGTAAETQQQLYFVLKNYDRPVVLDADALNCLSLNKDWLRLVPENSVLTPHPKEFERLFGASDNDFDRLALCIKMAVAHKVVIVLKGHFTAVAMPCGNVHFNSTGNPGMAKGGSGDVLTGILTGLLAQGYTPEETAILGVYLHGLAGNVAAAEFSQQSMLPSDIIQCLGKAFLALDSANAAG